MKKNKCIDCGKKLRGKKALRCRTCFLKYNWGENHFSWKKNKVISKCIDCDKILRNKRTIRCRNCHSVYMCGKNHPNYKGGKHKCIDCGKELNTWTAKRCRICYHISVRGKNHWNYKNGGNKCIDCRKIIKNRTAKRCRSCHALNMCGKNHPNWKGGPTSCLDCGKELNSHTAKRCQFCYMKFLIKCIGNKQNKSEVFLEKILNKILPKEYKYVGQGDIWIERYNPDFINMNGQKKIIEFFGNYWHKNSQERNKKRIKVFKKYGYDCLIIWEHDLKTQKTINQILEFHKKENKHEYRTAK